MFGTGVVRIDECEANRQVVGLGRGCVVGMFFSIFCYMGCVVCFSLESPHR